MKETLPRVWMLPILGAIALMLQACGSLPLSSADRINNTYDGVYNNFPAELVMVKSGRQLKGELSFWHFEHSVDTNRVQSVAEVKGTIDERSNNITFMFVKWISSPPDNYRMGVARGKWDPSKQLLSGNGFKFARRGTPEATRLLRGREILERHAVKRREAEDEYKKGSGQYALEKRKAQLAKTGMSLSNADNKNGYATARKAKPPVDWAILGLLIEVRQITFQDKTVALPYVVSVRDKGAAFFGGIYPGDVITFLKCGAWSYNFIDRQSHGVSHFPTYIGVGGDGTEDTHILSVANRCTRDRTTLITVATPESEKRTLRRFVELQASNGGGEWLTDRTMIESESKNEKEELSARYNELRQRAFAELRSKPCSYDVSNPYDLKAMPPIIREFAEMKVRFAGTEEHLPYWRDVIVAYCDEERNGKLPSLETALLRITRGELDPCTYDPSRDYTVQPEDPDRLQRRYSRRDYNHEIGFEYYLKALATPVQRQCFFEIMRAKLLGKKFVPKAASKTTRHRAMAEAKIN